MVRFTRRTALQAAGASIALPTIGTTAAAQASLETVVDIPGERVPENLAIDADGALYFSITDGEVWRVTPEQTQESGLALEDAEQVGELPGEAFGVEVTPDGTLYVALHAGAETGIWRVPRNDTGDEPDDEEEPVAEDGESADEDEAVGEDGIADEDDPADEEEPDDEDEAEVPEAEPFAIVGDEAEVFPNGIEYDRRRDRLLFTESFGGAVYEVPRDADDPETAAAVWFEDERLDAEEIGANGLTIDPDDNLFVAVTEDEVDGEEVGRLVHVPITDDGSAGDGETFLEDPELLGADGIEMHPLEEDLYVAAIVQSTLVRVSPEAEAETVSTADDGLVFPSDVTFGTIPDQAENLFVCNYAPEDPAEAAIFRWSP